MERCENYTLTFRSVYYPILWSEKKPVPPTTAIRLNGINVQSDFQKIINSTKHRGFWRDTGFGMLCIKAKDFQNLNGFPEYEAWGGEDGALSKKVKKGKLQMVRKRDPGLLHLYHSKNCSELMQFVNPEQAKMVISCEYSRKDHE